jgi:acyl carrier protein
MTIEERVISVIRENLENKQVAVITPHSELAKDLEIDSLNAMTILFGLEKEFSISLQESTFAACKTVQDVIAGLEKRVLPAEGAHDG